MKKIYLNSKLFILFFVFLLFSGIFISNFIISPIAVYQIKNPNIFAYIFLFFIFTFFLLHVYSYFQKFRKETKQDVSEPFSVSINFTRYVLKDTPRLLKYRLEKIMKILFFIFSIITIILISVTVYYINKNLFF
ncbi:MAG: hypothetical protein OEZ22_08580 [Spirochaetia bacterium]|nr:hypothetical protein [Spirochaetia bacterium]